MYHDLCWERSKNVLGDSALPYCLPAAVIQFGFFPSTPSLKMFCSLFRCSSLWVIIIRLIPSSGIVVFKEIFLKNVNILSRLSRRTGKRRKVHEGRGETKMLRREWLLKSIEKYWIPFLNIFVSPLPSCTFRLFPVQPSQPATLFTFLRNISFEDHNTRSLLLPVTHRLSHRLTS